MKRPLRPSLRWRLALWSAALAGGALLGFALLSSWLIYQAKVDRLDARLESLGPLARSGTGDGLPRQPEAAIAQALGLPDSQAVAMLAINPQGKIVSRSEQWPGPVPTTWPPLEGRGPEGGGPDGRRFERRDPDEPRLDRRGFDRLDRLDRLDRRGPRHLMTWPTPNGPWRVALRTTPLGQMAIAVNLQALHQEMATLRHIYLLTIPGLLLAIGGGAWGLAGQAPWRDPGLPSITG